MCDMYDTVWHCMTCEAINKGVRAGYIECQSISESKAVDIIELYFTQAAYWQQLADLTLLSWNLSIQLAL